MVTNILGIDIGGANLKFADLHNRALTVSFPLWKQSEQLAATLSRIFDKWSQFDQIALTMTGELADCYPRKSTGVEQIIQAVLTAAAGRSVAIWQTAGEFGDPEDGCEFWQLTAAANWHALATWAARMTGMNEAGLLVDIGSTTVDVIPLDSGQAIPAGLTDFERLNSSELIYTGGQRTPVIAVQNQMEWLGQPLRLAAELFATMQDVYLITGDIPENTADGDTADGRPADVPHARQRLARMLCCDTEEIPAELIDSLVDQLQSAQATQLCSGIQNVLERLPSSPTQLIVSGSCQFILDRLLPDITQLSAANVINLNHHLGPEIASAACAYAVAQLASERL